jgi:FkbM family methyltransferase
MQNKRILVALPTRKNIEPSTWLSIDRLIVPDGYEKTVETFYGYQVDQVRNLIAKYSIDLEYDYVLCVDSDIILPSDTLVKLLNAKKDVISGSYIQRKGDLHVVEVYEHREHGAVLNIPYEKMMMKDMAPFKVAGFGFGCVLVDTKVFKAMSWPWFEYRNAEKWENTVSEDITFCMKAEEHGFELWCDPSIRCPHVGETTYDILGTDFTKANDISIEFENTRIHYDFLRGMNAQVSTILDVGCSHLSFYYDCKEAFPNAQYYGIDASRVAEKLCMVRGIPFERAVVSDRHKQVDFYYNDYFVSGDSCYKENVDGYIYTPLTKTRRTTTTIDSIFEQNEWTKPDLIMMDIQGSEIEALKGASKTIQNCNHILLGVQFKEYNLGAPFEPEVLDFMRSIGYEKRGVVSSNETDAIYHFVKV